MTHLRGSRRATRLVKRARPQTSQSLLLKPTPMQNTYIMTGLTPYDTAMQLLIADLCRELENLVADVKTRAACADLDSKLEELCDRYKASDPHFEVLQPGSATSFKREANYPYRLILPIQLILRMNGRTRLTFINCYCRLTGEDDYDRLPIRNLDNQQSDAENQELNREAP